MRLRSALPEEPLVVLAPPDALRRALELLVQQAFAATPSGAGVTVSAHKEGAAVHLEVQDGGPGLSAAELEQRARTADPPVIGTIRNDRFRLDPRTLCEPELIMASVALTSVWTRD